MNLLQNEALAFDDVRLIPQRSDIGSRGADVSLISKLKRVGEMQTPFFAAPMSTVSEAEMGIALQHNAGAIAIIHRYNSIAKQIELVKQVSKNDLAVGAAVGVSGDYVERALEVIKAGAKIICVDIAHGHHSLMKTALQRLRSLFDVHIMAGNIATPEAYYDLSYWGADSVRCGIGGGSICSTTVQTGHGYPTWQTIYDLKPSRQSMPENIRAQIICDGGIKHLGDIAKAIGAGADFVMMGSMFAGHDEAPGDVVKKDGESVKRYLGMASKTAQMEWRGFHSSDEGVEATVPYKGPVKHTLGQMTKALKTSLSYSGCSNLQDFRERAKFVRVSSASAIEASPHIFLKG